MQPPPLSPQWAAAHWEANAEAWTAHARAGFDRYRDLVNTPGFLALLPPIAGLHGLDIGCGEASNTAHLARAGAAMTAIDIAPTFLRHARAAHPHIRFVRADAGALPFAPASFDFCTAFMSLMDMPHHAQALAEAHRVLRPGGFLQFSILHPCFVPPHRRNIRDAAGQVTALEVGGYFDRIDGRVDTWHFGAAPPAARAAVPPFREPRFHRTLSHWLNLLAAAGFILEAAGEPRPDAATAAAEPYVADNLVAPLFLHLRGRKP
jgi:SAM-dependent methyltransferase